MSTTAQKTFTWKATPAKGRSGANDSEIIAMSASEYRSRSTANDDALREAGRLQEINSKCDKCQGMKKFDVLCSYSVDPTASPAEYRGRCNPCIKAHRVCGSRTLPYTRAVSLRLPPIVQQTVDKDSDSSSTESDDMRDELASDSESSTSPNNRTNPGRRHGHPSQVVAKNVNGTRRRRQATILSKKEGYSRDRGKSDHRSDPSSSTTTHRRKPSKASPNPRPSTSRASKHSIAQLVTRLPSPVRGDALQALRDIIDNARRVEDIIHSYSSNA